MAANPKPHQQVPVAVVTEGADLVDQNKITINSSPQPAAEAVEVLKNGNGASYRSPMSDPALLEAIATLQNSVQATKEEAEAEFAEMKRNLGTIDHQIHHTLDLRQAKDRITFAKVAEGYGNKELAAALRSEPVKEGFFAGVDRMLEAPVKFRHIVYTAAGVTFLVIGWEVIAYKWDLPRFGMLDPSNPLKALPKK